MGGIVGEEEEENVYISLCQKLCKNLSRAFEAHHREALGNIVVLSKGVDLHV